VRDDLRAMGICRAMLLMFREGSFDAGNYFLSFKEPPPQIEQSEADIEARLKACFKAARVAAGKAE
jgi:hypothetical protein